ncbi:MAG: PilZ domain-containing protein [Planctomycetes bacterium]|nr:PilZ domain-containing protein [Planctomycetota bacterium]
MSANAQPYLQSLEHAPRAGIPVWLDQRKSPRVEYTAVVPVNAASHDGAAVPSVFETVETRDLSQQGISFCAATAPADRPIVLRLGTEGAPVQMLARVTRCERDYDDPMRRFIVACEFVGLLP